MYVGRQTCFVHIYLCMYECMHVSIDIHMDCKYIYLCRQICKNMYGCVYVCISHYWHMPLNKYACHIVHVCPTVVLLYSTYRLQITAYKSKKTYISYYWGMPLNQYACHIASNATMLLLQSTYRQHITPYINKKWQTATLLYSAIAT